MEQSLSQFSCMNTHHVVMIVIQLKQLH